MEYLVLACRAVLIVVFSVSLASKVRSRAAFAEFTASLSVMRVLPRVRTRWTAVAGIFAETVALFLLLAAPFSVPLAFAFALVLLIGFSAAITIVLARGERAPCRCFGASTRPLGWSHVARNLFLGALCVVGVVTPAPTAQWHPGGVMLAMFAGAIVALLVLRMDDLITLFSSAPGAGTSKTVRTRM
jgi:hypothetical protein